MAENVSWIKKPSTILSKRSRPINNHADINSTLNLLNANQSDNTIIRPPKRKSCMMFKERKVVQVPCEKKIKQNDRGPTEFKNRTLKMVHGQRLSIARPTALRPRSQLPCPSTGAYLKTSPIHMSTPCDPPRSILKANTKDNLLSVGKRVNFDQLEPGIGPLQESTIQDFTQYDFKKFNTVAKVDASTNTEDAQPPEGDKDKEKDIFGLLNQMRKDILGLQSKLDAMETKICCCKSSYNSVNTPNQFQKFVYKLDNINEDNETGIQEESSQTKETPENHFEAEKMEIKLTSVGFSKLSDVQEESCSSTETTVYKNIEKENTSDNVTASIEEPVVHQTINNLKEAEDSVEAVTSSDSEQKKRISKLQVSSPIRLKLRNLRKRAIPRHLQSFELSPKPRKGSNKE